MRKHLLTGISLVAICATAPAFAQETTSSIRGALTAEGAPVNGASVSITHVPSGTTATTASGTDGSFNASGLRIGGPYTVTVKADGYADQTITDIFLSAGTPLRLPIALEPMGAEIVVTAASIGAADLGTGPATVVDRRGIEGVASVTRDIRDIVRRDPFATIDPTTRGVSVAGQNARLNKFSVDGLRFSDNFGLNNGGLPTARGPVPIDAIEQLSVKIAPQDISEGDFQGGAVNVVLRSGTNTFTGSAFYSYTDDSLTGDQTRDRRVNLDFKSKNYGAFLAGPIIKDKLFFAVSYEWLREGTPISIGTAGFANVVPNLTDAQIANISSIAQSVYNYDTLGVTPSTIEGDKKYTAKIDWNIMDGQRLSLTYIRNDSAQTSTAGFSSVSATSPVLALGSNNYRRPEKVDSFVGQLNSDWSDNFHTEVRGNYRAYDLSPVPFGEFPFAQMQVCLDPNATTQQNGAANTNPVNCSQGTTAAPGAARIYFGPDQFRHFNYVRTKQYGFDIAARWAMGGLDMKLTAAWSHLDVANAFTQNAYGNYYFDSVSQFQNRQANQLSLGGSITGDLNDVLASFKYDQYTVGLQGTYEPSDTLSLTAGMRVDTYGGITPPPLNSFFLQRYGFSNNHVINGKIIYQPRFSASWTPTSELTFRAGIGLFGGGSPDVFLGNSYSVSGVFANSIVISRQADGTCGDEKIVSREVCNAALNNVDGRTINPLVLDYLRNSTTSISNANVNAMDPNYKMQSTWKANLSADYRPASLGFLGSGWSFGGDVYYGIVQNAPLYVDLRLRQIGTAPDGRPRYATITPGANTDYYLTNTSKGYSLVTVARAAKTFDFGLTVNASYTFQDIKDVSAMNGTTASGTYGQNAVSDPNVAAYGTSTYEIRHAIKLGFDYDHAFFGDYKTRFSLFAERRSGTPYSLTMIDLAGSNGHGNAFGVAGTNSRYLLYVPTLNDPLVANTTAADAATLASLNAFIDANGLGKYRGKILPKNSQRSPNFFKVDLHVDQEIPVPLVSTGRIKLFADVENVLNLIDKDWGSLRQVVFPYLAPVVNVSCVTVGSNSCGQYRYSNFQNPNVVNQARFSLWGVRVGAKIQF